MDDLRARNIYMLLEDEITDAVLISQNAGILMMSRDENGEWVGNYGQMTSEGIATWVTSIATLNAAGWLPDDWQPTVEPLGMITMKLGDRIVTNTIYPIEGEERYIGTSTESPYAFYMSEYTKDKFLKTADDFGE